MSEFISNILWFLLFVFVFLFVMKINVTIDDGNDVIVEKEQPQQKSEKELQKINICDCTIWVDSERKIEKIDCPESPNNYIVKRYSSNYQNN